MLAGAVADHDVGLIRIGGLPVQESFDESQPDRSGLRHTSPYPFAERFLPARKGWPVPAHASGRQAAQRVAVDGVLAGELLIVTTERTVQVG